MTALPRIIAAIALASGLSGCVPNYTLQKLAKDRQDRAISEQAAEATQALLMEIIETLRSKLAKVEVDLDNALGRSRNLQRAYSGAGKHIVELVEKLAKAREGLEAIKQRPLMNGPDEPWADGYDLALEECQHIARQTLAQIGDA